MEYQLKKLDKFTYVEEGQGETLLLLHGLFGALSNFKDLVEYFRKDYKVVVPILPLFTLDIFHTTVGGLEKFVHKFIEAKGLNNIHLLGNSLGGHVALVHVLKHPEKIKTLTLTGSSGLFENGGRSVRTLRVRSGVCSFCRKDTAGEGMSPSQAALTPCHSCSVIVRAVA